MDPKRYSSAHPNLPQALLNCDCAAVNREQLLEIYSQLAERYPKWSQQRCLDRAYVELVKAFSVAS